MKWTLPDLRQKRISWADRTEMDELRCERFIMMPFGRHLNCSRRRQSGGRTRQGKADDTVWAWNHWKLFEMVLVGCYGSLEPFWLQSIPPLRVRALGRIYSANTSNSSSAGFASSKNEMGRNPTDYFLFTSQTYFAPVMFPFCLML